MIRLLAAHLAPRRTQTALEAELPLGGPMAFNAAAAVLLIGLLALALIGGDYVRTVLSIGCAYLVAALGYNVVLGYGGQMAFGQAAFMAIGAYVFAVLQQAGWPSAAAFVAGVAAAGAAAAAMGLAVLRTREFYLALVTLAFAQAVIVLINLWPASHGDDGISATLLGKQDVYLAVPLAVCSLLVVDRLVRSRFGRALAMIRSDEEAAAAMGVRVAQTRILAFVLSGVFGGVGGVLLAGTLRYITPSGFSANVTLLLLTMIVVGGLASVWGTALGVAALLLVSQLLSISLGLQGLLYGAILFAFLVARPMGLISLSEVPRQVRRQSTGTRS